MLHLQNYQRKLAEVHHQEQLMSPLVVHSSGLLRDFTPLKRERVESSPFSSPALDDTYTNNSVRKEVGICEYVRIDDDVDQCCLMALKEYVNDEIDDDDSTAIHDENIFFLGDEVGELSLGCHKGVDELLDFQVEEEATGQQNCLQKLTIRRTIAKSISPRNRAESPRGIDTEFQNACDWMAQQQIYRQQSMKNKRHLSSNRCTPPALSQVRPMFVADAHSSVADLESDFNEVYPDTPRHGKTMKFFQSPEEESPAPTSQKRKSGPENGRVNITLPEPDSSWYNNFFGSDLRLQSRQGRVSRLMSRLSNVSFGSSTPSIHRCHQLIEILSEEEFLAIAGFKDYGNGLAEC